VITKGQPFEVVASGGQERVDGQDRRCSACCYAVYLLLRFKRLKDLAMPEFSRQIDEEPPINKAVEDVLAIAGGDPEQEGMVIYAMMNLCCERMAASLSRSKCRDMLHILDGFIRDASPARPWPE
jgi:hypothetical protein